MNKPYLLLFLLLVSTVPAFSQTDTSARGSSYIACKTFPHVDDTMPRGNAADAILAKHHEYKGPVVIAQLGYIDTTSATVEEIRNNLEVGLMALPSERYEIVSFSMGLLRKGCDYWGNYHCNGNKIPLDVLDKLGMQRLHLEAKIYFTDIRVRRKGSDRSLPLKSFYIQVE